MSVNLKFEGSKSPFETVVLSSLTIAKTISMYSGKLVLAPMVRSGELPTRLMALKYGADLVWSPEIIDKKIMKCKRVENKKLGTIDFMEVNDKQSKPKFPGYSDLVFRTLPKLETGKIIFQMGSANPDFAVAAAHVVAKDVDGIDLNSGCPKPFLTHAGMGAALLLTPDLLEAILVKLVQEVGKVYNIPISVKIRLLSDTDAAPTVALVDRLCRTGIANLTLHCRTRDMRNRELPLRNFLPEIIAACKSHGVSFIINGAIRNRHEHEQLQAEFGSDVGGMIAEAAEANPTCFSATPLAWGAVAREFIETAMEHDNFPGNTKYIVLNQIPGRLPYYQKIAKCKTHEQMLETLENIEETHKSKVVQKFLLKAYLVDPLDANKLQYPEDTNVVVSQFESTAGSKIERRKERRENEKKRAAEEVEASKKQRLEVAA